MVKGGREVLSPILAALSRLIEQAINWLLCTLQSGRKLFFVKRCALVALMQVDGKIVNKEELDAFETWACQCK